MTIIWIEWVKRKHNKVTVTGFSLFKMWLVDNLKLHMCGVHYVSIGKYCSRSFRVTFSYPEVGE